MIQIIAAVLLITSLPATSPAELISIFASSTNIKKFNHLDRNKKDDPNSAYNQRKKLSDIDITKVPEWQNYEQIAEAFDLIRTERRFPDPEVRKFLRRIPWLYYHDGCFTRAGLAAERLNKLSYPDTAQFYVFGQLQLKKKSKKWHYHVALAARIKNEVYILDVAVNHLRPLKLNDWLTEFLSDSQAETAMASICHETTWFPNANCKKSSFKAWGGDHTLKEWNKLFWLPSERILLKDQADLYLGENPPWFNEE